MVILKKSALTVCLALAVLFVCPILSFTRDPLPATASTEIKGISGGAAVTVEGKVLFYVQSKILSITPENRAEIINKRINKILKDPLLSVDSIRVSYGETTTDVIAGDLTIMTVTEIYAKLSSWKDVRIHPVKFHEFEILSSARLTHVLLSLLR